MSRKLENWFVWGIKPTHLVSECEEKQLREAREVHMGVCSHLIEMCPLTERHCTWNYALIRTTFCSLE